MIPGSEIGKIISPKVLEFILSRAQGKPLKYFNRSPIIFYFKIQLNDEKWIQLYI